MYAVRMVDVYSFSCLVSSLIMQMLTILCKLSRNPLVVPRVPTIIITTTK